ncbi:unnamed protein product [Ostreobium quekettii]|uniref:Vacuolar protein 14 C-terminal Fig4-binding domain-containing protein n=1 Tax=Ostreobium quekettii TaxID=121088 RepID=A0A8S1IRP7_9CHLO|nr:unnamed protein product [Ostreobium quekettii]|eukprot:evm.model.scf_566.1 EVM.evm.TU.scf_566.1   scf_566:4630-12185(-)
MASGGDPELLPALVVRNIGDKLYEKRKTAALEVEQLVKKFASTGHKEKIKALVGRLVDDFALSGQANLRKGGLLCLAAATVGLRSVNDENLNNLSFPRLLGDIVRPVALSLSDQDSRVRYYACEALFNIAKVTREDFITDKYLFQEVFSALFRLYGDADVNVQNAAQHLDEVLKNIVTSSAEFDLEAFIQLLRSCLSVPNAHKRQFLIGWVTALYSEPTIDMLPYVPEISEGLMNMLSDEHKEIRTSASRALQDFLVDISQAYEDTVDFPKVMDMLISKASSPETTTCLTAMKWMDAVLQKNIMDVIEKYAQMVGVVLSCISHPNPDVQESADSVNTLLLQMDDAEAWALVDMRALLEAISKELSSNQEPTRLQALRWFEFLLEHNGKAVLEESTVVVGAVLDALAMNWENVVQASLKLLAAIAQQEGHFSPVMAEVLGRFRGTEGTRLLHRSGSHIVQRLSCLLGPQEVYTELASLLERGNSDDGFTGTMVQSLNIYLVTAPELRDLQVQLHQGLADEKCATLFRALYPSWCHSVSAVLTLCFLSQAYDLAWLLINSIGNVACGPSMSTVVQIIRVVKLLETPAFTYLRLQLLQPERYPYLMQCMHGLLMLLPQTEAFKTLYVRLKSTPVVPLSLASCSALSTPGNAKRPQGDDHGAPSGLDYSSLVDIFVRCQQRNEEKERHACNGK